MRFGRELKQLGLEVCTGIDLRRLRMVERRRKRVE